MKPFIMRSARLIHKKSDMLKRDLMPGIFNLNAKNDFNKIILHGLIKRLKTG